MVDYDADGNIVGAEVLDATKRGNLERLLEKQSRARQALHG